MCKRSSLQVSKGRDFRQGHPRGETSRLVKVKDTLTSDWFLCLAGLATWLVAGLPIFADLAQEPAHLLEARYLVWLLAFFTFGAAFWQVSRAGDQVHSKRQLGALIGVQLFATLVALALIPFDLASVLLVILASQYAWLGSLRLAVSLVLLQSAVATLIHALSVEWTAVELIFNAGIYLSFQIFALFTSYTALSEAKAREELAQVNAELRATQALLAESSRTAERVRIARDLHDLMGHHLTALSLNLEVASHVSEGKSLEHVQKAQSLTKLLLSDVRETVSTLREDTALDLSAALEMLTRDIPSLKIHLALPRDLDLDDPHRAQVALRCVQEVITNTLKHAQAENLWLELRHTPSGIEISAHDDGRGAKEVTAGNGLSGMRERLVSLGGDLSLTSSPGGGFALRATLPA